MPLKNDVGICSTRNLPSTLAFFQTGSSLGSQGRAALSDHQQFTFLYTCMVPQNCLHLNLLLLHLQASHSNTSP